MAFRFLRERGLRPVTRNFRTRRGEIDLVMLDGSCLTFIEVRYRNDSSFVGAAQTVDARKQKKLAAAAAMFLSANSQFRAHVCRFDVIGVNSDQQGALSVDWLQDAFRPGV